MSRIFDKIDKHYTDGNIAKVLVDTYIDFSKFDCVVEPSAGGGSFIDTIPPKMRTIAVDIKPDRDDIFQCDFFDIEDHFHFSSLDDKILTLGNPPFGYRAQMAVDFINHASIFSDTIAFILPRSFRKPYVINQIDDNFHLIMDIDIEGDIFNTGTCARTCFQIWKKLPYKREKIYLPRFACDFDPVPQGLKFKKEYCDLAIRRTGWKKVGEVLMPEDANPITQFIFIKKTNPNISIDDLKANLIFINNDINRVAFNTSMAPTFAVGELCLEYNKKFEERNEVI